MQEQSDALACGKSEGCVPGPTAEEDRTGPRARRRPRRACRSFLGRQPRPLGR